MPHWSHNSRRLARPGPRAEVALGFWLAATLTITLIQSGCSSLGETVGRAFGGKVSFDVQVEDDLNRDFPLAVDLVVVYDKEAYKALSSMTAATWFAGRTAYKQSNEPKKVEIHSWEWVPPCEQCPGPGQQTVHYRVGAQGAVLFANYLTEGSHRVQIQPLKRFRLDLGETDLTVRPWKSAKGSGSTSGPPAASSTSKGKNKDKGKSAG